MAIKVSEKARERINALADKRNKSRTLIFSVRGGGCSGFSYRFDFATDEECDDIENMSEQKPKYKLFSFDKFEIIVPVKAYLFVNGTEIDWVEEMMGQRFVFNNPNVASSCGCGESISFNVEENNET